MWPAEFAVWLASPAGAGAILGLAFLLGAMVGSFLNVVVHRVPRGETVVHGRSRCPACRTTIRARDNLPVVGWLLLGGRCRDCGAPIAARYPLVEAACGAISAGIAATVLATASATDPGRLVTVWAFRTAVAMTLLAWALLVAEGHVVTRWTVVIAVAATMLAAAWTDALRPLPIGRPGAGPAAAADRLVASLVGLGAGAAAGAISATAPAACGLVGAALGWQAAILAAVAASITRMAGWRDPAAGITAMAVLTGGPLLEAAWVAAWRGWAGG